MRTFLLLLAACRASAEDTPPVAAPAAPVRATCPAAFAGLPTGTHRGFEAVGQRREVVVRWPEGVSRPPVFFAFNGTGESGATFWTRAELDDFVAAGFVVVAPSSAGNGTLWPVWDGLRARGAENDPNADVALFDALYDCIDDRVDTARVFAGGHSAGGIFTNHLLQRRADVLAGGIVASGIYSQTSPVPALSSAAGLTVIVTWGGENDRWSGRAGSVAVRDFAFAAEGDVAAGAYQALGASALACHGYEVGHAWLHRMNGFMAELLASRPKGSAALTEVPLLPKAGEATCTLGPTPDREAAGLVCPQSTVPGCQEVCQQVADGAATNATVGAVLRPQLRKLGFADDSCAGCVARCEALGRSVADQAALACFGEQPKVDPRVGGLAGALPLVDAVNTCCGGSDGAWCTEVCGTMRQNLAARAYFEGCR